MTAQQKQSGAEAPAAAGVAGAQSEQTDDEQDVAEDQSDDLTDLVEGVDAPDGVHVGGIETAEDQAGGEQDRPGHQSPTAPAHELFTTHVDASLDVLLDRRPEKIERSAGPQRGHPA